MRIAALPVESLVREGSYPPCWLAWVSILPVAAVAKIEHAK